MAVFLKGGNRRKLQTAEMARAAQKTALDRANNNDISTTMIAFSEESMNDAFGLKQGRLIWLLDSIIERLRKQQ
jgi:hypothetical protein